jgi:hypothetical protein
MKSFEVTLGVATVESYDSGRGFVMVVDAPTAFDAALKAEQEGDARLPDSDFAFCHAAKVRPLAIPVVPAMLAAA